MKGRQHTSVNCEAPVRGEEREVCRTIEFVQATVHAGVVVQSGEVGAWRLESGEEDKCPDANPRYLRTTPQIMMAYIGERLSDISSVILRGDGSSGVDVAQIKKKNHPSELPDTEFTEKVALVVRKRAGSIADLERQLTAVQQIIGV